MGTQESRVSARASRSGTEGESARHGRARRLAGSRLQALLAAASIAALATPGAAQTPGLVAAFNFDVDGAGTVIDLSGNGNDGICTPGSTCPTFTASGGHSGGAYDFTGNGNFIEVRNEASFDFTIAFSASLWMRTSNFGNAWAQLLGKGDSAWGIERQLKTGSISFTTFTPSSDNLVGPPNLQDGQWHHVAVVYDGSRKLLYVDGQVAAQRNLTAAISTNNVAVRLGFNTEYPTGQYDGRIDDVRIYNRALSQAEVQNDMTTPVGASTPPRVNILSPAVNELVRGADLTIGYLLSGDLTEVDHASFSLDGGPHVDDGDLDGELIMPGLPEGPHTLAASLVRDDHSTITGTNTTISFSSTLQPDPSQSFVNEIYLTGLNLPTTIQFTPDGRMLIGELPGRIWVLRPGASAVEPAPFLQLSNVGSEATQQGLMDIELDPDFVANGQYYVFYTLGSPNRDRVSRFTAQGDVTDAASELVLWQDDRDAHAEHHGGSLVIGNDGMLYISTGEHFNAALAQRLDTYRGKILRIGRDGGIPPGNPFHDGIGPNFDAIWAIGLRNPFRTSYDAPTGRLFIGDVGGNNAATAYEEINLGRAGGNYGWPLCEGPCATPDPPIYSYAHGGRDASVTGGFVYRGSSFPTEYHGNYFYADYVQSWIRRLIFDPVTGAVTGSNPFFPFDGAADGPWGDIVHLTEGPDGAIYYADLGFDDQSGTFTEGKIRRIVYRPANAPPVASASAEPTVGPAPLTVQFSSEGSHDPEGLALGYSWDFGDGALSTERDPVHDYAENGGYQARLTVSDGVSTSTSPSIHIGVGSAPQLQILSPLDGGLFRAGDVISFGAVATDPDDGALPAAAFTWTISLLHDSHVHPGLPIFGTSSGSFPIPMSGHDFSGNTRYEFRTSVTDSDGSQATASATVFPEKVDLQFDTAPTGLAVMLDGIQRTAPFTLDTLVGFVHGVQAPDQPFGGRQYRFVSWSDGGAAAHEIDVPAQEHAYLASFELVPLTARPGLIAAFNFDGPGGSPVLDRSDHGNHAVCAPGATCPLFSATGGRTLGGANFAGAGNYLELPNEASFDFTTSFTVSFWMKTSGFVNRWEQLVGKGDSAWSIERQDKSSRISFTTFGPTSDNLVSVRSLADNGWHHVAGVYDGAIKRIYVDGQLEASRPYNRTLRTNNFPVRLGYNQEYPAGQYSGWLDDVRIYDRALTQTEIAEDMATPIP